MKRLFIPLCAKPFKEFESGNKSWELRKISSTFNPNNIFVGQLVELRCGYVAKNGVIWGKVTDFKVFSCLRDAFFEIPYNKIISADNEEEASRYICELMEISKEEEIALIAIKIEKHEIKGEIIFDDKFLSLISSGGKTTTIRNGIRSYSPGLYNAFNVSKTKCVLIKIDSTEIIKFGLLTDINAVTDGYLSVKDLKNDLLQYYPDLTDDREMTIVHFVGV